jgi:hypothetical protein
MWVLNLSRINFIPVIKKITEVMINKEVIKILLWVGVLFVFCPTVAMAQGDNNCPSGRQSALNQVQSFLADSAWNSERQELGISVDADQARVLSDAQDLSECQTLSEMFPDPDKKNRFFYKAGSYYFVIYKWEENSEGDMIVGSPGFIILNDNFEALRFYV